MLIGDLVDSKMVQLGHFNTMNKPISFDLQIWKDTKFGNKLPAPHARLVFLCSHSSLFFSKEI
jgi:hypothetical protein